MKRIISLRPVPLIPGMVVMFLVIHTCQLFEPEGLLVVNTYYISGITDTSAVAGGVVTDDGGSEVTARGVCWNTSDKPIVSNNHTTDGSGTGNFNSNIIGLSPETTYYVRAYATNSAGTIYGQVESFTTRIPSTTDIDGNIYQTVQVGDQVWMAENLKTTRYADGSAIPLVQGTNEWKNLTMTDKAYCWYDNSTDNRDIYGGLYTWFAAMNGAFSNDANPSGVQGVCPDGWHLPSDAEWKELEMFLGMSQAEADQYGTRGTDEGGKLKEKGNKHWYGLNTGATNESNFTALPGGVGGGSFFLMGYVAVFWTATEYDANEFWDRRLSYDDASISRLASGSAAGYSVRCVKGSGSTVSSPTVTTNAATLVAGTIVVLNGNVTGDGGGTVIDRGFYYGLSTDPSTTGIKVSEGSGTGSFSTTLGGLSPGDTYYFVAYTTNSAGTSYGDELSFTMISESTGTVTDIDGNVYQTVQIGDQVWMARNLMVTHYADDSAIPLAENAAEDYKGYCWYDNSTDNRDIYGGLYTWAAAMNGVAGSDANPSGVQGVCPDGWHLPSDAEWKELEMSLGMSQSEADQQGRRGTDEGGWLKEAGTAHWISPNTGGTNWSGFAALPGGYGTLGGSFSNLGFSAFFWSATERDTVNAWDRDLFHDGAYVLRISDHKHLLFSVRCLSDD